METPTPVDVNKLKSILGNAKKVMKAVEEKSPITIKNNVNENYDNYSTQSAYYDERDEREPVYESYSPPVSQSIDTRDYTAEDIMRSKMPENVKQAMLNKPIPKLSYGAVTSSFGLEGLEELIEKPTKRPTQKAPIRESINNGSMEQMVTISISQLNEMIDNRVNKLLAEMFTKTISEQTIKKTINTLIKEGKVTTKK